MKYSWIDQNKVYWNSIKANGTAPDKLVKEMLDKSYQLVLGGLGKKKQKELLEGGNHGI